MSLELVREAVRLNQFVGDDTTQTIVENDIIVPDVKPDIARILMLDGDAWIEGAEAVQDKLLVSGTIRYKILYISDDTERQLKSITTTAPFQHALDIPEARQGMRCKAVCNIEHVEYEILNSRKINVKTILNLYGKVSNPENRYITQGFDGVDGIQVLKNTIGVNSYIGDSREDYLVSEILEVPAGKPAILEVLRNDIRIAGLEYKPADDKIVAKGEINVSTLYIGDDEARSIHFMEHEIPFSQVIEMPGADEDTYCNVDIELGDMSFNIEEDADGEPRQLKCEAMLKIFAECSGKKAIEFVEDAYSPFSRLSIEKEQLKLEELVSENSTQTTVKETVDISENAPDISEIFNVIGKLSLSGSEISDDRISVEGVVVANILYLSNDAEQPVYCECREIPFKQALDVKGAKAGMGLDVEMSVQHCSYTIISSKEVEIRFVIGLNTRVTKQLDIPVISNAVEQPFDDKRLMQQPSVIIYFAQPGDTLWKIAKKYYTTVDELIKTNSFENKDKLTQGEQIIITRRL